MPERESPTEHCNGISTSPSEYRYPPIPEGVTGGKFTTIPNADDRRWEALSDSAAKEGNAAHRRMLDKEIAETVFAYLGIDSPKELEAFFVALQNLTRQDGRITISASGIRRVKAEWPDGR